jgi:hypothetical protein
MEPMSAEESLVVVGGVLGFAVQMMQDRREDLQSLHDGKLHQLGTRVDE